MLCGSDNSQPRDKMILEVRVHIRTPADILSDDQ